MSVKGLSENYTFSEALPVWEKGKENEMNHSLIFRGILDGGINAELRIANHSNRQIFVNGDFIAGGTARAAHGFYRADVYDLTPYLTHKKNTVAIIAAGYNVNSFYLTDEKPFVCAEIVSGDSVLYSTGVKEFEVIAYLYRLKKTQRYSFQRPFTESYIFDAGYDTFLTEPEEKFKNVILEKTENKRFLERNVPYCENKIIKAESILSQGIFIPVKEHKEYSDRSYDDIGDKLKGYKKEELESKAVEELYSWGIQPMETEKYLFEPINLGINCYGVYDMGLNTSGYIKLTVTAQEDIVLYAVFNEVLDGDFPDAGRNGCANVVKWALQGGRTYNLISFEPYTYKYMGLVSMYGKALISSVAQIRVTFNESLIVNEPELPDDALRKIYSAAKESFVQNAVDIYMDCPSRERAGWLCDSFFTSRVEYSLTGESRVEHNFLENFILPEKFRYVPEGMLPMCYPADHTDGVYIPNWAMWYALEMREYVKRSSDTELAGKARARLYELLAFFRKYENSDGLLEKLDSWIFIEWSQANSFVRDINYPSNMLYAMFKEALAELYSDAQLKAEAAALKAEIIKQSFDGEFFRDNAVINKDGKAEIQNNRSETNQYYAFFSGTADKESFPGLWEKLVNDFGPGRKTSGKYPDIVPSNAFIGNYLRLELLFNAGLTEKAENEIREFFLPMAEKTGTLWENMTDNASCCHGFASHVIYWLNK